MCGSHSEIVVVRHIGRPIDHPFHQREKCRRQSYRNCSNVALVRAVVCFQALPLVVGDGGPVADSAPSMRLRQSLTTRCRRQSLTWFNMLHVRVLTASHGGGAMENDVGAVHVRHADWLTPPRLFKTAAVGTGYLPTKIRLLAGRLCRLDVQARPKRAGSASVPYTGA
jgi:hypothetical protein